MRHPRIGLLSVVGGLLLVGWIAFAIARSGGDQPEPTDLTVTWGGSEGHPSCAYDADEQTVRATLLVEGDAPGGREITVTVTAFADENTSVPVGSTTRTVQVEGSTHPLLHVDIRVSAAPHVDSDGEAACSLSVTEGASPETRRRAPRTAS